MTDIKKVPAIPSPDMFVGPDGVMAGPGYSYLNQLATTLSEVRALLSTVEGATEANAESIAALSQVETPSIPFKKRYPVNESSGFVSSGVIFSIPSVQGDAGDIVTFPPLGNVSDNASWGPPIAVRDGFTTIEGTGPVLTNAVHAIDFYMDDQFLYEVARFTKTIGGSISVSVNTTYPYGSGLSHTLPDSEPHSFSLWVRAVNGTQSFRCTMIGHIDVYEPAASTL